MSLTNQLMSDEYAVVGTIDPDAYAAGTVLSDAIDMEKYDSIVAIVMAGTLGASATLDASVTQAATSGGTYKAITGAAITQLTQASPDNSDSVALINVRQSALDLDNDYRWVKLSMTVATATSDAGAVILGRAKSRPANDNDLADVVEIVSV